MNNDIKEISYDAMKKTLWVHYENGTSYFYEGEKAVFLFEKYK